MGDAIWIAVGSTLLFFGPLWQVSVLVHREVELLKEHNHAFQEVTSEASAAAASVYSRWRWMKRSRARSRARKLARGVLTPEELRREKAFDRQSLAWSLVMLGGLVLAVNSWMRVGNLWGT